MIKASLPDDARPLRYPQDTGHWQRYLLVYIGNINGTSSDWVRYGSSFTRLDVLGVSSRRFSSRTVGRGFRPGDAFVQYETGEGRVIARGMNRHGVGLYVLRPMTPSERRGLARGIRTAERELRWRRNSYCEDTKRKGRKT
jgi:hypothetical protein